MTAPGPAPMTDGGRIDAYEAYVDAAAAVLGLPLAPEHRPGVLRYFALAAGFAAQLDAVVLDPHDDPAEAFVPLGPDEVTAAALPGVSPSSSPAAPEAAP